MCFQIVWMLFRCARSVIFESGLARELKLPFGFGLRSSFMSEFSSSATSEGRGDDLSELEKRGKLIVSNARQVRRLIDEHCESIGREPSSVSLIPVSKTKPVEDIQALYDEGFRHFGENYFQELLEKAANLPDDIQWHFIGHLQSSKSARLVREVPNLSVVETVDSEKLATKLNNGCVLVDRENLDIFIQVDTSGEDSKSGVPASQLAALITAIRDSCPRLQIKGLMAIGAPGDATCFDRLVECAREAQQLIDSDRLLELSMGMSADYKEAISKGSTSVRVGSTIFGARSYPPAK
jgi:PLP dependent protein